LILGCFEGIPFEAANLEFPESTSATAKQPEAPNQVVPGTLKPEFLAELVAQGLLPEESSKEENPVAKFGPCFKDFLLYRADSIADIQAALSHQFTLSSNGVFDLDDYKGEYLVVCVCDL